MVHRINAWYLIGVYCAHTKAGALRAEKSGGLDLPWGIKTPIDEAIFWNALRQGARLQRGEINHFQHAWELVKFAFLRWGKAS